MSKTKDFYFDQITEGLTESNDEFSDDDYRVDNDDKVHYTHCGGTCKYGEDSTCPVVVAENENIFNLTGSYPI